jgi:hypothetical protein
MSSVCTTAELATIPARRRANVVFPLAVRPSTPTSVADPPPDDRVEHQRRELHERHDPPRAD